jgi:hypothetical protein
VCRPNSGAGGAETPNNESGIDTELEARRIADEVVKLHKAGAIKNEQDASFYANLVHRFGSSFTGNSPSFSLPPDSASHGLTTRVA